MVDIPVAQALTGLFNAAPNLQSGNGEFDMWEFTSTLRQLTLVSFGLQADLNTTQNLGDVLGLPVDDLAPGFEMDASMIPIRMAINPKSVTFEQPKRFVKRDTRNGSVFFHFTNDRGQNNDILTLRFRGNTGNIDLRGSLTEPRTDDTGALMKLQVFHNLYQLSREPMLLGNNIVNVFSITYSSQLLPVPIEFRGFFNKVLDFEESADKPNSRDYSFDFTVTATEPDLDDLVVEVMSVLQDAPATASDVSTLFGDSVFSGGE